MSKPAAPSASELPRELPLVGRKNDLDRLYRVFGHETRVEPMVLVTGDPGVGKSRLAEVVAAEAARRGWTVASGRAYPVETGMPYNLLSDAFLPILREYDEAALTVLTRGKSGDLRQLFPALGGAEVELDGWDPGELRTRLYWSFTEFLKRLAERAPLLIVAEDLHWADASSLSLLHFVIRQLQGDRIRVLGTVSSGYGLEIDSLDHLERSLTSLGILERHELSPITPEATEELLRALFQVSGPPLREFSSHLYEWTHGNPYFLEETLKTLVHTGRLYQRDGTWLGWDLQHLDLPGSIRDAVLLRLRTLSADARAVAELVSVSGGRASVRLVGLVAELGSSELMDAVEELTRHAIADEQEEDREVFIELRHPMLRETLYQDLGPSRRRLLHRRLAESLEEMHRASRAPVDQLAYHFTRGGVSGADSRAVRYLSEAGQSALRRHADREAVAYLESALERYPEPGAVERSDLVTRRELQSELARGLARLGRYDDAAALWTDLLSQAGDHDAQAASRALRHLGLLAFWNGRHEEALSHYEASLKAIRDRGEGALEARILLARGVALQELGRPDDAKACIEESLKLARDLDDPTLVGRAHRALALLFTWVGSADEARRHGWQAVELADRVGDPYVRFWGRWALASLEGLTGDTKEMSRLLVETRQVADELRSPVFSLWTAELEVEYAYATGDWDGALAQGERAISLATSLSQTGLLPRLLVWTATVYLGRGDLARAREMVDRAWSMAGLDDEGQSRFDVHVVVPAHIGRAACLLAEERYDEAAEVGQAGVELADRAGYVFWSLHLLLPILAEAHLRRRDLEGAAVIGRRLREEGAAIGHRLATAWADACDALVLWISGDVERGLTMLEAAADALDAIPIRYDAARVRRQFAGRLADLGRRDEAVAALRRVTDVFAALGAQPELDRCRIMFEENGARFPLLPRPPGPANLTPRESEIAHLVAARLTNTAVSRKLGISVRTVTTHLHNIYRKLGIGSRGQLVDLIREGRLPARRAGEG